MAAQAHQPHFIVFPLMAQGHMIPMIDIAKLLAQRGVKVTIVTTPLNAERFKTIISRTKLSIQFLELGFPCKEAGLPAGCENLDKLPSLDWASKFFVATIPYPKACISWNLLLFSLVLTQSQGTHNVLDEVTSDSDYFMVPGLPHKIELTKAQLPGFNPSSSSGLKNVSDQIRKAEKDVYGVVVNTFEELEAEYVKGYKKAKGERVWSSVKEGIDELMDGGIEGEERRRRARQLGELANRATEEAGSSNPNITMLIKDIMEYPNCDDQ
ncbi:UDP-glucosyl transferase 73C1 [Actinidia rufa]|uniref:UDP-glucosyl transferase 73C1 n=1 Tax=Actinidia rufa TaxID=165716 RepID=A0A7J0E1N6_9ERIC|nr:UDP-glucosyl transferase 73C1 [Actinidia rufa]